MNGIGLLVLIAAAGQVAAAQPVGPNRDFGWERDTQNPDRALCYIIQLSPAKVAEMQGKAMENPSDMPPELVGRATRILVRIGTDVLPQTPSLEELRNTPRVNSPADVTAQLGGGRLSDVEPSDLLNVQQRGNSPSLPNFPGQSSVTPQSSAPPLGIAPPASGLAMPRSNFNDSDSQASTNPIDQAKQLDRGAPAFPNPAGNSRGNPTGGTSPTLPNFADSGSNQTNGAGATTNNNATPNAGGSYPQNTYPQNTYPQNTYPQSTLPPGYDPRTPPSLDPSTMTSIPNRQTPNIGFGANPNGQNQGKFGLSTPGFDNFSGQGQAGQNGQGGQYGQNYGGGQYANGQYGSGNGQRPSGFDRVASNTNVPPPPQQPLPKPTTAEASPGDTVTNPAKSISNSKTGENILSVFFLFSLVVNFYLGMLIRKLLTRYRALLANMRGQTSPTAFSS